MKNKKRKIDRKHLIHTFVFALFCVFGLTVAYAALSSTLNISGSAQVASSEWDISIEKYALSDHLGDSYEFACSGDVICNDNCMLVGNASIVKSPVLTNTSIKDFSFSGSLPGDGVLYLYKVVNNGTIPAKLESINYLTPTYSGTESDIEWLNNNAAMIASLGSDVYEEDSMQVGEILCPGQFGILMVGFVIADSATTIPSGSVTISNAGADYVFTQDKLTSCPT